MYVMIGYIGKNETYETLGPKQDIYLVIDDTDIENPADAMPSIRKQIKTIGKIDFTKAKNPTNARKSVEQLLKVSNGNKIPYPEFVKKIEDLLLKYIK